MADSKGISKAVRVVVADARGEILASSDTGGDVSVVEFRYTFDDEDPDECQIKLQTSDPLAFDKLQIGRSIQLQVAWGFVGGPMTYPATVVVRDLESKYGHEQITITLLCTDFLTYLSTTRSEQGGEFSVIDHIKNEFIDKYQVVIKSSGNLVWKLGFDKIQEKQVLVQVPDEVMPFDPYLIHTLTGLGTGTKIIVPAHETYVTEITGSEQETWGDNIDTTIKEWLEKPRGVIQSNRSQFTVLRDLFKDCPKGPWYVTGRGNTLLIHNRDFTSGPVRKYTYKGEPGTLIDFSAKTKYDQFEKNSVSHDIYDPVNKKFYEVGAYLDELFSMTTFQEKFEDKSMTKEEYGAWLEKWVDLLKAYEKWYATRVPFNFTEKNISDNTKITKTIRINSYIDIPDVPRTVPVALQDNTRMPQISPYYNEVAILRGYQYIRPIQFMEDRDNYVNNEKRFMEMEKEEASFIVIGDPLLQSQMRVQVDNVHYQHKGLYYIKKCEHIISVNGYKTELKGIKVISTNRLSTLSKLSSVGLDKDGKVRPDAEKQWIKEQELFGKPIELETSVAGFRKLTPGVASSAGHVPMMYGQSNYRVITDIQEELNSENFVEKVTELKYGGKTIVKPNTENN